MKCCLRRRRVNDHLVRKVSGQHEVYPARTATNVPLPLSWSNNDIIRAPVPVIVTSSDGLVCAHAGLHGSVATGDGS